MRFIFLLLFIAGSGCLFAQQPYVPPSPNVSAMIKFSNIEVSHYTGVPNISIPFGELPGKDISIPIGLQYHASGIKVQDVASSVGLGWNLYAGGAITRVVRGLPDGIENNCANELASYRDNVDKGCDFERDIFYFSFLGRSGKMFIDDADKIQTMPYLDIKISNGLLSSTGWTITDEQGYKYFFGETPGALEEITYYTGNDVSGYEEEYTFKSTWYLTKIISPAGVQVATFAYYIGSDFEYVMYAQQFIIPPSGTAYNVDINTKIKVKQAKYINTISTSIATGQFNYVTTRQDLTNGWQLRSIDFKDQDGSVKRKFGLTLDYFLCDNIPQTGIVSPCRMRLTSIKEGVANPIESFSFLYHELSVNPYRTNIYSDDYGYYNYKSAAIGDTRISNMCDFNNGISKNQVFDKTRVFSLREIFNNLGGRTVFEYDSIGRRILRIKSISNYEHSSLVAKSTYTYSSPQGINTPYYSYTAHDGTIICTSSSLKDLYDLNGTTVGY